MLLAARIVAPGRLGALALAVSVAYVVTILARGVAGEPIMTICPRLEGAELRRAERDAVMASLVVGCLLAAAIAPIVLAQSSVTEDFGWIALCIPAVLVQDALRHVAFARQRPGVALVSDCAWMVVQFGLLAGTIATHTETVHWIVACWGAGAAAGAVVGAIALRIPPFGSPRRWYHQSFSYSRWLVPQLGLSQVTDQANGLILLVVFGSAALGGFRAMQTFVRPAFIFMLAMQVLLVPGLTRRLVAHGHSDLMREARRMAVWVALIAVALVVPVVVAARPLSRIVLGQSYVRYSGFLLPFAVATVLSACAVLPNAGLRALQRGRPIFLVQLIASALAFVAVFGAAWFSTVYVAAWATTVFGIASAGLAWVALSRSEGVREARAASIESWSESPDGILHRLTQYCENVKASETTHFNVTIDLASHDGVRCDHARDRVDQSGIAR
jgi:O-antigen/teichoic acid export membrane protein